MNWYIPIKLSFRGNFPRINDIDQALNDPYKPERVQDGLGLDLNTPGDKDRSGYGVDYYTDRKPPVSSKKPEYTTVPKWVGDFDGQDPDKNDMSPKMTDGFGMYDPDSPLSIERSTAVKLEKGEDRDNSSTGPFNQQIPSQTRNFFDKVKRRLTF